MKRIEIIFMLLFIATIIIAQNNKSISMQPEMTQIWDPEVPVITPGDSPLDAPSDAIVLFNGGNLEKEWTNSFGDKPRWEVKNNILTIVKGSGIIKTKRVFEDFQLHIEWRSPLEVEGNGQGRGNSGIFLQELYEIQILDSYNNRTYSNGQAASIYKQYAPLVNVCKPPGEWQTYDIIYTAPRFKDENTYFTPPTVTILHNGILVQNNVKLRGPAKNIGIPEHSIKKHGPGSLILQDHNNPVSFRNIWIRNL
jgi:hypothetical protein